MSNHTPTPWGIESTWSFHTITDSCGDEIAKVMNGSDGDLFHEDQDHELIKQNKANARHIVKCVNNYDRLVADLSKMVELYESEVHDSWDGTSQVNAMLSKSGGARKLIEELEQDQ